MVQNIIDAIAILIGVPMLILAYFIPTFVARRRRHRDEGAIFVLNFLIGWTFLGWLIALVWANTGNIEKQTAQWGCGLMRPYDRDGRHPIRFVFALLDRVAPRRAEFESPRNIISDCDC